MSDNLKMVSILKYLSKYWHKICADWVVVICALFGAFLIRFDGVFPPNFISSYLIVSMVGVFIKTILLFWFRPFTTTWRQVSFYDARRLILMVALSTLAWIASVYILFPRQLPRSIPIIDAMLSVILLFGIRVIVRYIFEFSKMLSARNQSHSARRIIIIGAGQAGAMLVREIKKHPELGMRPELFLDDDPHKQGQNLSNIPVLGSVNEIAYWVEKYDIDEVIFAISAKSGHLLRETIQLTEHLDRKLKFRTIPPIIDLLDDDVTVDRIREVKVEDLLGRDAVELDKDDIESLITNKVVLVTGAGGSIGSELVRQVAKFMPQKIALLGRGENSLYLIEKEIRNKFPELELDIFLCDIQNSSRLKYIFGELQPDVVLHAAAHKHVPLIEQNPTEAVFNNILGTKNLVTAALAANVRTFVNISTDKSVNPTSVMGASKHVAESIVYEKGRQNPKASYVTVRFGNVLGSRGSVIPLFKEQIKNGGPVTVTHPDMVRYFMTIPEAAQLVLQAAAFGKTGKVYVLDMGSPVKIYDLAKNLIRLSGLELEKDIDIVFTGIRFGEKLYEELSTNNENRIRTLHPKIFEVSKSANDMLEQHLTSLEGEANSGNDDAIRYQLNEYVEGAKINLKNQKTS